MILLSLLVIGLAIGLIPVYQFFQHNQEVATPSTAPVTQGSTQAPTRAQPSDTPTKQPTQESAQAAITPLPPTPTAQPTDTPPPTMTSTQPPSVTSSATTIPSFTATPLPISTPSPAPTGTTQIVDTSTPLPRLATVIYVQSSGQTHTLGVTTSTNQLINADLHRHAAAPAWSPDGAKIAFFGEPGIGELGSPYNEGEGIWVIDPQGRNPHQLVKTNYVKIITWSPDGLKLAYEFGPPEHTHEVILIDANNGLEINRFSGEQPAWIPDNHGFAIKACLPECGLWQVDLKGHTERQITFYDTDSYPFWSLNGDLIFTSERDGNWEIYLLRQNSDTPQRLTNRPGTDTTPVFSSDGGEIYLRTDAFGDWRITGIALDGSNEHLIQQGVGVSNDWGLARPAAY